MKEGWIKDILVALFPIILTGMGYLIITVINLQDQIATIQADNQIARDQLSDELKDQIHDVDKRVAIVESKQ